MGPAGSRVQGLPSSARRFESDRLQQSNHPSRQAGATTTDDAMTYSQTAVRVNRHHIRLYDLRAGTIEEGDGRYLAYDADHRPLGNWSSERRALHAIEQDALRQLYPPRRPRR